jgi:thiol-disulfide isomerase/thioredoxin
MRFLLALLLCLGIVSLSDAATPAIKPVVLSLQGIDGGKALDMVKADLEKIKGVKKVTYDTRTVEATVEMSARVPTATLISAVEDAGFLAVEGPGQGKWMPPKGYPEGSDVGVVSETGDEIPNVDDLAVPGKVTLVDFYADWCRPCRMVDEHVYEVLDKRKDVAVRKINIVDWNTPASRQVLKFGDGIPLTIVYGKKGQRLGLVSGFMPHDLDALIDVGGGPGDPSTSTPASAPASAGSSR